MYAPSLQVMPPRLGNKVGLFATRTPHRPNNIGLSLVRLKEVRYVRLPASSYGYMRCTWRSPPASRRACTVACGYIRLHTATHGIASRRACTATVCYTLHPWQVRGDTLYLSGVDLIDGTPIMDVKPYIAFADSADGSTVAPWLQPEAQQGKDLKVSFPRRRRLHDCCMTVT